MSVNRLREPEDKAKNSDRLQELEDRVAALERITKPTAVRIDPDLIYTATETAAILCCSKTNVYNLMLSGELARTSVGAGKKGLRVRGSDLLHFLDSRREGGPAPRGDFKYLEN